MRLKAVITFLNDHKIDIFLVLYTVFILVVPLPVTIHIYGHIVNSLGFLLSNIPHFLFQQFQTSGPSSLLTIVNHLLAMLSLELWVGGFLSVFYPTIILVFPSMKVALDSDLLCIAFTQCDLYLFCLITITLVSMMIARIGLLSSPATFLSYDHERITVYVKCFIFGGSAVLSIITNLTCETMCNGRIYFFGASYMLYDDFVDFDALNFEMDCLSPTFLHIMFLVMVLLTVAASYLAPEGGLNRFFKRGRTHRVYPTVSALSEGLTQDGQLGNQAQGDKDMLKKRTKLFMFGFINCFLYSLKTFSYLALGNKYLRDNYGHVLTAMFTWLSRFMYILIPWFWMFYSPTFLTYSKHRINIIILSFFSMEIWPDPIYNWASRLYIRQNQFQIPITQIQPKYHPQAKTSMALWPGGDQSHVINLGQNTEPCQNNVQSRKMKSRRSI